MRARGFVAGATGLTGRAVVRHLLREGAEAVAHVRPSSSALAAHRAHFEGLGATVDTTAWEEEAMAETLRRLAPTVVFAALGTTRRRMKRAAAAGADPSLHGYEAVDYGLTSLLRRAAEASGARPRFVYVSMVGLGDLSKDHRNPYTQVRVRIERELRAGDLPYTVIRPAFISGDREEVRLGERLGARLGDAALALVGALGARELRDRYRSITGDQLGRACVRHGLDPGSENRTLGPEALRL